jgi:hypothetical protein
MKAWNRWWALGVLVVWFVGCHARGISSTDGNTNFLIGCRSTCAGGLDCICGVCTLGCAGDGDCKAIATRASCIPASQARLACSAAGPTKVCDATCRSNRDCSAFAAAPYCEGGHCRADLVESSVAPPDASARPDSSIGSGGVGRGFAGCADAGDTLSTWSCIPSGTIQDLHRVWGTGRTDVWAVGAAGTILHFNGSAWSGIPSGTARDLYGVWGSRPDDVWAVGQSTILHFNGSVWAASATTNRIADLFGIWGSGPSDVWAVGDKGVLEHWNGSTWRDTGTGLLIGMTQTFRGVWGSGPSDVWAVGQTCQASGPSQGCGQDSLQHWNGSAWSIPYSGPTFGFVDVWGSGPGDVWAVGNPSNTGAFFLHSDGSGWSIVSRADLSYAANSVWGSGPNDVWTVGSGGLVGAEAGPASPTGTILNWNGSNWSPVVMNSAIRFEGVWGSGPNDVWAVGSAGTIIHH